MKAPIAVMSFNRPDFLAPVLDSLKAQRGDALEGREIHLFQDGARNRYSHVRYARDEDIEASLACFRAAFPGGVVHYAGDNIGIYENFAAAESYFFAERDVDCAYFFEDDLVVSPVYLEMMEILQRFAERSDRIAYFAAYGDYYASRDEVAQRRREVITLDHHWAFGLLRRHWGAIRGAMAGYAALVAGQDYARRDHRAIYAHYDAFAAAPRGSSQDAAKAFACDRLGLWRCRTFAPFAKYIGNRGAHMTQAVYDSLGFSKTEILQTPIPNLRFPEERDIDRFLSEQHALFQEFHARELPALRAALPARKFNPFRPCTAEDVADAYRLLLHREPESQAIADRHVGATPVIQFVRGVVDSAEFRALLAGRAGARPLDAQRPCTEADVVALYRLLLNRDPDSRAMIDTYVGAFKVGRLVVQIIDSTEFAEIGQRVAA